jgi:hypothetical protein
MERPPQASSKLSREVPAVPYHGNEINWLGYCNQRVFRDGLSVDSEIQDEKPYFREDRSSFG